jgi:hypothetical protein
MYSGPVVSSINIGLSSKKMDWGFAFFFNLFKKPRPHRPTSALIFNANENRQ